MREAAGSLPGSSAHIGGMTIGIDFADLGIEAVFVPDEEEAAPAPIRSSRNLIEGSVMAKALFSVWDGAPVTVIDSPPGAGKTTTVTRIVAALRERSDLTIVVASPTKRGAYDLSERIAAEMGPDGSGNPQVVLRVSKMDPPPNVSKGTPEDLEWNTPVVRTVASCRAKPPQCDLMIFDEAYQVTFSDAAAAADLAQQVLMVGDPGQIGPVITADVSAFRGRETAPHMRAPEVFSRMEDAAVYSLESTYRVGEPTVKAIAPLYAFPFRSTRPERHLVDAHGQAIPEIVSLEVPVAVTFDALDTLVRVARAAAAMVGMELAETGADGTVSRRLLEPEDVAVVVAHNAQSSGIDAVLRAMNVEGITVGTADRLQGGQWQAVVALDPCVGYVTAGSHQLSPGRLCVMASRHMSHLTWVHDGAWESALSGPDVDQHEAGLGLQVRRELTSW